MLIVVNLNENIDYFFINEVYTCNNVIVVAPSFAYQEVVLQVHLKLSYVNTCVCHCCRKGGFAIVFQHRAR